MRLASILFCFALGACGDGGEAATSTTAAGAGAQGGAGGQGGATGGGGSGGTAGSGGEAVPLVSEIECEGGQNPPGTGVAAGDDLHKVTLDAYPEAVCNDGSPAILYVRAAGDVANAGRWVFHFQGGGVCGVDYQTCKDRWCGVGPYKGSKMTSTLAPEVMHADAVFGREPTNLLGNANQVWLYYCSSDAWAGRAADVVLTNPDDASERFRMHVRGHDIAMAVFDVLLAGAVTSDDGIVTMPSLADATEVVVTGTSAGGGGVINNGDAVAALFDPGSTQVWLVIDALLGPDLGDIDDAVIASAVEDAFSAAAAATNAATNAFQDESCAAAHGGADAWMCSWSPHLRNHHLTTPFFARGDLADPVVFNQYEAAGATIVQYAQWTRTAALGVQNVPSDAEEAAGIVRAPGVYSQGCGQHVGLTNVDYYSAATVEDQNGAPRTLHGAVVSWLLGNDFTAVDTVPPTTSVCPMTTGETD
jgi:hypothetical protein